MAGPKQPDCPEPATDRRPASEPTSLSLLERVRANEPAAWQRLLALYRPLVAFWCLRAGLPGQDVDDVLQDVFAAAASGLARFHRDRPGDTFRGWLRVITRNALLGHFRRNQRQIQAEGGSAALSQLRDIADPLPGPADGEAAEVSKLYHRALEQVRGEFAPTTWQAFWRTVVDGRSPAGLTDELGMGVAAIRQAKSRVLRRLKQEVGELLE